MDALFQRLRGEMEYDNPPRPSNVPATGRIVFKNTLEFCEGMIEEGYAIWEWPTWEARTEEENKELK